MKYNWSVTLKKILLSLIFITSFLILHPFKAQAQFFFMEPEQIGQDAPNFMLPQVGSDKVLELNNVIKEKKAVIFYWATWCPHCRVALKELNQDIKKYQDLGIVLITVDLGEQKDVVEKYVEYNKITLPVFLDQDQSTAEKFGIVGLPTFFFVNEDGKITFVAHSMPDEIEQAFKL